MKTLKQQFYLISQEKGRFYNFRAQRNSMKKGSIVHIHRKVQLQYHSSGLSFIMYIKILLDAFMEFSIGRNTYVKIKVIAITKCQLCHC